MGSLHIFSENYFSNSQLWTTRVEQSLFHIKLVTLALNLGSDTGALCLGKASCAISSRGILYVLAFWQCCTQGAQWASNSQCTMCIHWPSIFHPGLQPSAPVDSDAKLCFLISLSPRQFHQTLHIQIIPLNLADRVIIIITHYGHALFTRRARQESTDASQERTKQNQLKFQVLLLLGGVTP